MITKDTPIVKLKGNKKDGYVLEIRNNLDGFKADLALTEPELIAIKEVLSKKLK